jgi:DNA uptake protein ComE-like DNA-binding protein
MHKNFRSRLVELLLLPLVSWGIILTLVLGGVLLSGIGLWQLFGTKSDAAVESEKQLEQGKAQFCTPPEKKEITVDVSGAVIAPGVYVLEQGDRIADAVALAGGLSSLADAVLVSRDLNFAVLLTDGQKVRIPLKGEQEICAQVAAQATGDTTTTRISINSASQKTLENLTGIGEKRAQDIIAGRPYVALEELVDKKVLTAAMFEKLKEEIQL